MQIRRKISYATEDLSEYWFPRALNVLKVFFYWAGVVIVALVTLPLSKERRDRMVAGISNATAKAMWGLRDSVFMREIFPPMRNLVRVAVYSADGNLKMEDYGFNLRTNEGRDLNCDRLGKTSAIPNSPFFVAIHNGSSYTPNATDVIGTWDAVQVPVASGFGRQQGVYAHTIGNPNYTLVANWAASATVTGYGAALLNSSGPTGGTTFCIKNFGTPASMISGDTLQVTWDITV